MLISFPDENWQIGISAKREHEALKHSRLSKNIDFGEKWFGIQCSERNNVFANLSGLTQAQQEYIVAELKKTLG